MTNWILAYLFVTMQIIGRIERHRGSFKQFIKKYWDNIFLSIGAVFGLMYGFCNEFGIILLSKLSFLKIDKLVQGMIDLGLQDKLLTAMAILIGIFNYDLIKSTPRIIKQFFINFGKIIKQKK